MAILSGCFLTGLIFYKSFINPTKIMYFYVAITFLTEMFGYYSLYLSSEKKVNFLLYNIYAPISFLVISVYFCKIINEKKIKKVIFLMIPLVLSISIFLSFSYSNKMLNYRVLLFSMGVLIVYSVVFFRQLLNSDASFLENPNFWIVTGILFFYTGYFFLSGFINYIASKDAVLARKLFTINHLLNIIYYSLITYGFICQRKLAKSSS